MQILFRDQEINLTFNALFIRKIDKAIGLKMEGNELGKGLTFLISGLKDADFNVVAETLVHASPKFGGFKNVDEAIEFISELIEKGEAEGKEDALQDFCNELLEELGKLPIIRREIKKVEKREAERA